MHSIFHFVSIKIVDLVLITFLFIGALRGYRRGVLQEFFSLMAIMIGVVGANLYSSYFYNYVQKAMESGGKILPYIIFITVFIVLFLVVSFMGKLVQKIIRSTFLGIIDELLGAVFGFIYWAFLISCILFTIEKLGIHIPYEYAKESKLLPYIKKVLPEVLKFFSHWLPAIKSKKPIYNFMIWQ